jgi:hypothetical protein
VEEGEADEVGVEGVPEAGDYAAQETRHLFRTARPLTLRLLNHRLSHRVLIAVAVRGTCCGTLRPAFDLLLDRAPPLRSHPLLLAGSAGWQVGRHDSNWGLNRLLNYKAHRPFEFKYPPLPPRRRPSATLSVTLHFCRRPAPPPSPPHRPLPPRPPCPPRVLPFKL